MKKSKPSKIHTFIIDAITTAAFAGFMFSCFKVYFEGWAVNTTTTLILSGIWMLLYSAAWGAFDFKGGYENVLD